MNVATKGCFFKNATMFVRYFFKSLMLYSSTHKDSHILAFDKINVKLPLNEGNIADFI